MIRTMRTARSLTALAAVLAATTIAVAPSTGATPLAGQSLPANGQTAQTTPTSAPAAATASAADFASIFASQNGSLAGSGWATCVAPIQWSLDSSGLTASERTAQIKNLAWAFQQWSLASGLTFAFVGEQAVAYDDAAFTVTPADGSGVQTRHVYLDFVKASESTRLDGGTVGLGSPSQVMPTSKEIVAGEAVFRTDHVKGASNKELKSLYLHELGHVLGLAHAQVDSNIMYPIVSDHLRLGPGDVNGVKAMTKTCAA
ncbi:MAG: matrixin family metalloprotease [Actinomycetes bacterium]